MADEVQVRVGDRLPVPGTTLRVEVLELGRCDERVCPDRRLAMIRDPQLGIEDWVHVAEALDPDGFWDATVAALRDYRPEVG